MLTVVAAETLVAGLEMILAYCSSFYCWLLFSVIVGYSKNQETAYYSSSSCWYYCLEAIGSLHSVSVAGGEHCSPQLWVTAIFEANINDSICCQHGIILEKKTINLSSKVMEKSVYKKLPKISVIISCIIL